MLEARQFDFWPGEWDVVSRNRRPDDPQWYTTGAATNRVYAVVDGCGIVEHWRGEAFGQFIVGFSLRADITDRSFRWQQDLSRDTGLTWSPT